MEGFDVEPGFVTNNQMAVFLVYHAPDAFY